MINENPDISNHKDERKITLKKRSQLVNQMYTK